MKSKKIDHTFAYEQLSYDAKPNYQSTYIKLSFFFSKIPDVSYEHFHKHWECIHADLTVGTKSFRSNKVLRYVQLHAFPELKKMVTDSGMELLDYDGCSEIYVKDMESWNTFASSTDFQKALMPDAGNMGMALPFRVMASIENVIYGQGLTEIGGIDGVTIETPRVDGN